MNKLLQRISITILSIGCLVSTQSHAQSMCCPDQCQPACCTPSPACGPCWDTCDLCGDFEIGAHALYWKTMTCDWQYGRLPTAGHTKVLSVTSDYDWGFRVFGLYNRDCFFAQLSYVWLQTRDATKKLDLVSVNGFGTLVTRLEQATASLKYDYQNVDLRLGQYLHHKCGCKFGLFGNIRWVDLEEHRKLAGVNELTGDLGPAQLDYTAEFDGVGLGVGATGEYCMWAGFNAFGEFNFLAVIGDRKTPTSRFETSNTTGTVDFTSNTCVVPAADLRLGFNFKWACGCFTTVWELGWEVNYYWNVLERVDQAAANDSAPNSIRQCVDLGFSGPFAGARILF